MTSEEVKTFQNTVWEYYHEHGRHDLPWCQPEADGQIDPYKVLVSEFMLQQTQVSRVIPKFENFIRQFPTIQALAVAPLAQILKAWSGLGYNRRAKFLWQTAGILACEFQGRLPDNLSELGRLPGIGPNTAGAVLVYSYNKPIVFIETNIRTVFIHHFFADKQQVHDKEIADLIAQTLPDNPRQWYWALMDYGTYLKSTVGNLNKLSKHYTKQSRFVGSQRQIRGQILRLLSDGPHNITEVKKVIPDERLAQILQDLLNEGLIDISGDYYRLAGV